MAYVGMKRKAEQEATGSSRPRPSQAPHLKKDAPTTAPRPSNTKKPAAKKKPRRKVGGTQRKAIDNRSDYFWRADVGHKNAICPMKDACLAQHVPITVTQFGNLSLATNAGEQMFVVFGACQQNIAAMSVGSSSNSAVLFSTYGDLISSSPESVRPSRKTVTFSSYASLDSTEGLFHVAHVTSPLALSWNAAVPGSLATVGHWNYLKSIALTHSSSKSMPIADLRSPKSWSLKPTSAIGAATWKNFSTYPFAGSDATKAAANLQLEADLKQESQSALVFYFPQTTSAQNIQWKIHEQISCRFPASGVMASLNTNTADHATMTVDPPSAHPHVGRGGYM